MTRTVGYVWHLRAKMADKGMFQTSELVPLLAERGVHLSREQVYRLVTHPPQRLSMDILAALCDILEVTPNDLIEITASARQVRKPAARSGGGAAPQPSAPRSGPPQRSWTGSPVTATSSEPSASTISTSGSSASAPTPSGR